MEIETQLTIEDFPIGTLIEWRTNDIKNFGVVFKNEHGFIKVRPLSQPFNWYFNDETLINFKVRKIN
tara:strand:- start:825 stop:1025 length:201 start_codon:yes stop_codon:yes gene_type:complete